MNERIKALVEQATTEEHDGFRYFDKAKFAELIVKETMQVVANQLPSNVYLDVADAVIKHYGDK